MLCCRGERDGNDMIYQKVIIIAVRVRTRTRVALARVGSFDFLLGYFRIVLGVPAQTEPKPT